jgi:hypothetical protein
MRKQFELNDPESCLNRAQNNEMLFVIRGHDVAAAYTIRAWCQMRITMRKNKPDDPQITEALAAADIMERER